MLSENNTSNEQPIVQTNSVSDLGTQQDVSDESVSTSEPVKQSKSFTEEQMRIISNQVRKDVERRTEERLRSEYEAQYRPQSSEQQSSEQAQPAYNEEQLYNNFKARQEREQHEANTQYIANEFLQKLQSTGKAEKIESSGIGNLPVNHPLIPMLNGLDNISDVIDDFDSNPIKVANLLAITHLNSMNGFRELQNISNSIKRNKEALARDKAPAPLSQLKPSSYGLGGGPRTISDKRRDPSMKF